MQSIVSVLIIMRWWIWWLSNCTPAPILSVLSHKYGGRNFAIVQFDKSCHLYYQILVNYISSINSAHPLLADPYLTIATAIHHHRDAHRIPLFISFLSHSSHIISTYTQIMQIDPSIRNGTESLVNNTRKVVACIFVARYHGNDHAVCAFSMHWIQFFFCSWEIDHRD